MFVSCAKLNAELALKQDALADCNGNPLPAGTEMATCADLAAITIADATETVKGKVELATTAEASAGTSTTTVVTPAGLKAALDAAAPNLKTCSGEDMAFDAQVPTCTEMNAAIAASVVTVPDATDTTKGKVALNLGTSLPGDATNCTDALTACGLNALLTDPAAGGNAVINNVKALVPLATTTIAGLIEEATGEETRLGATDANRADRAVTPESMSYTLQTNKLYPLAVAGADGTSSGTFRGAITSPYAGNNYANVYSYIPSGTLSPVSGTSCSSIEGTAWEGAVVTTQFNGVAGTISAGGAGTKRGVLGFSNGTGGTNIGVYGYAVNGATNWAGYFDGNVTAGPITTLSDETLKENVEAIDAAKALQFRNGLRWVSYEMFTEQQEPIMETVTDGEGNETQVPTGRYEVKRNSLGKKRGLIAQEVQALAASIGDFSDVVQVTGEYFTLDAQGYPVKDAQGKNIVNKRLGLDYDAVSFIVMCAEQSALIPA